jgi:hypothetical protein
MLKEVRDAGLAGLLVAATNPHNDRTSEDRGFTTSIEDNLQAV